MPNIIVSYRRDDTRHITGRIFDRLEQHYGKSHVFMDIDNIPVGMDFRQHILNTIDHCDALVAVVGPRWIGTEPSGQPRISEPNDWVRIELETALTKDIPVIPVLIDRARMPKPDELPGTLQDFAYRQAADLDTGRDFHRHMDRLIHDISESITRRQAEAKRREEEEAARRQQEAAERKRRDDEERLRREAEGKRRSEEVRDREEILERSDGRGQERQVPNPRVSGRPTWSRGRRALLIASPLAVALLAIGVWSARTPSSPPVPTPTSRPAAINQPRDAQPPIAQPPVPLVQSPSATADQATCRDASGDTAIAACDRAIASGALAETDLAAAFVSRGVEYGKKQDYDRAIADYNQAIKLDPNSALAFRNRGLAYYYKQDYDRGIADYNQAIKLDPNSAIAFYNRGLAYYYKRDYDRAIADYNRAIKLDPNDAAAFNNRGYAYQAKQDYDRAIPDYNEAIKLDPNDALVFRNRGLAYYYKQDYDRAIADYNQAIKLDPNDAAALYNRGLSKQRQGDRAGGATDIAAARKIDPNVGK